MQAPILSADATTCRFLEQASQGCREIATATQCMSVLTIHIDRPGNEAMCCRRSTQVKEIQPFSLFSVSCAFFALWQGPHERRLRTLRSVVDLCWARLGIRFGCTARVLGLKHKQRCAKAGDRGGSNTFSMTQVRSLAGCCRPGSQSWNSRAQRPLHRRERQLPQLPSSSWRTLPPSLT